MSIVDVDQKALLRAHDIVVVPVPNTQNVCCGYSVEGERGGGCVCMHACM